VSSAEAQAGHAQLPSVRALWQPRLADSTHTHVLHTAGHQQGRAFCQRRPQGLRDWRPARAGEYGCGWWALQGRSRLASGAHTKAVQAGVTAARSCACQSVCRCWACRCACVRASYFSVLRSVSYVLWGPGAEGRAASLGAALCSGPSILVAGLHVQTLVWAGLGWLGATAHHPPRPRLLRAPRAPQVAESDGEVYAVSNKCSHHAPRRWRRVTARCMQSPTSARTWASRLWARPRCCRAR